MINIISANYSIFNSHQIAKSTLSVAYKCALTVLVGVGSNFVKGILMGIAYEQPFLMKSRAYVRIPSMLASAAHFLVALSDAPLQLLKIKRTGVLYLVLTGPIIEELKYRVVLQELFLKRGVTFTAKQLGFSIDPNNFYVKCSRVFLSSMIFTAAHSWTLSRNPKINPFGPAGFPIFMVGSLILGAAQEITGNVTYPIALHVMNNIVPAIVFKLLKKN